MNRRELFKFAAGAAVGTLIGGDAEELPPRIMGSYTVYDDVTLLLTDADISDVINGDWTVSLPEAQAGREVFIKNARTRESVRLISDGRTWHVV